MQSSSQQNKAQTHAQTRAPAQQPQNQQQNQPQSIMIKLKNLLHNELFLRNIKRGLILSAFAICVAFFCYINPFEIITKYTVFSICVILMLGATLTIMTFTNNSPAAMNVLKTGMTYVAAILFVIFVLFELSELSKRINVTNVGWLSTAIFAAIILVILIIVVKILENMKSKPPLVDFIVNVILYVPCLFSNMFENTYSSMFNTQATTSKSIVILLIVEILLIVAYFMVPYIRTKYYKEVYIGGDKHGKLLVNHPINTADEYVVISYIDLNCPDDGVTSITSDAAASDADTDADADTSDVRSNNTCKFEYNYALSCWFNIDAFPPSTSSMYNNYTTILNYGDKPNVRYKGSTNTLIITVKDNDNNSGVNAIIDKLKQSGDYNNEQLAQKLKEVGIELDEFGNRIVYKNNNVLLQKWNYLVINYVGGTLDVFMNGKLERSSIEVVPFIKYDNLIIGAQKGISGGIASLIYFRQPLSIIEIHDMYDKFKEKNPPIFPDNTEILTARKVIHK